MSGTDSGFFFTLPFQAKKVIDTLLGNCILQWCGAVIAAWHRGSVRASHPAASGLILDFLTTEISSEVFKCSNAAVDGTKTE